MMMETKKTSVGIVFIFKESQSEDLTAILQKRGSYDFEKKQKESYAGIYQLTAHGGLENGETPMQGLLREIAEELQSFEINNYVKSHLKDIKLIKSFEKSDKEIISYALLIDPSLINSIRLHKSSGGVALVTKSDLGRAIAADSAMKSGIDDQSHIVMFADDLAALKTAFEIF